MDASDEEILEPARRQGRVVPTQDLDFSALLALGGYDQPSLITLRLGMSDPETHASDIAGRIGLADVRAFGLTWEDCDAFLSRLGDRAKIDVFSELISEGVGA